MKINNVKFKKQVNPGDTLIFDLNLDEPIRRGICTMTGKAYVNGVLVTEAELMAQIVKTKIHINESTTSLRSSRGKNC